MIHFLTRYRKGFSVFASVCFILQSLAGAIVFSVIISQTDELATFSCVDAMVDPNSTYKEVVKKACYSRYEHAYNSPFPLQNFAVMSFCIPILILWVYSSVVAVRIEEIEAIDRTLNESEQTDLTRTNGENVTIRLRNGTTCYVFNMYSMYLVSRFVLGILLAVLQLVVFYPNGFDSQFTCRLPTPQIHSTALKYSRQLNVTIVCENGVAEKNEMWGIIMYVFNILFASLALGELLYLGRRHPVLNCRSRGAWTCDAEFVTVYLLRKRYPRLDIQELGRCSFSESIEYYKQEILSTSSILADISYGRGVSLDDFFINCVIFTGRAAHIKFFERMDRHEIYDVYMRAPAESTFFKDLKDLFYPNYDTEDRFPRTILVVGRPGIGKTVLTQKIMWDWANGVDPFYHGKIAFYFKCRWFNLDEFKMMSLKRFCCFGAGLSEEKLESLFKSILEEPSKAIFIFDGLDELSLYDLEQSSVFSNDIDLNMSGQSFVMKLVAGKVLPGATTLVTSRPTAECLLSRIAFDRKVEVVGFSEEKIEEYVGRYCDNHNREDLKLKILNHITSSLELWNLCYIPACCYSVCVSLFYHYTDVATCEHPITLSGLYMTLVCFLRKSHYRISDKMSSAVTLKKLQYLALDGMKKGQFVFSEISFDKQMKNCGLVHCLSNPIFPHKTQFCFIHLSIQEFLAAKYLTETYSPDEIKGFISSHAESDNWHLVLQFVRGLLEEKMVIPEL